MSQPDSKREMTISLIVKSLTLRISATLILSLFITVPAHAYFDGGTITVLWQGLIGGLAVVLASISLSWQKFRSLFYRIKNRDKRKKKSKEEFKDLEPS